MSPRRMRRSDVERLIADRVAEAITKHERIRPNPVNTGGFVAPNVHGCTYKTFINGKPHPFNGSEGVVGLRHWSEKVESCADLVEWKSIEIQRMKQELWTLTLKGEDIERVKGKAARIDESNKRKWEDHQRKNNNNNSNNNNRNHNFNNQHQQQNRRQETAKAYAAAPAEGRGYAGNLIWCNHCNSHQNGQFPPKCWRCQRTGHQEKDCRVRILGAGVNSLEDVTCCGCGKKGHYKNKCPKKTNQQNEVARGRAYVMRTEDP
ncbi:putative reverse transcriptase domain-containing protein [Tanacetum coccineum]